MVSGASGDFCAQTFLFGFPTALRRRPNPPHGCRHRRSRDRRINAFRSSRNVRTLGPDQTVGESFVPKCPPGDADRKEISCGTVAARYAFLDFRADLDDARGAAHRVRGALAARPLTPRPVALYEVPNRGSSEDLPRPPEEGTSLIPHGEMIPEVPERSTVSRGPAGTIIEDPELARVRARGSWVRSRRSSANEEATESFIVESRGRDSPRHVDRCEALE